MRGQSPNTGEDVTFRPLSPVLGGEGGVRGLPSEPSPSYDYPTKAWLVEIEEGRSDGEYGEDGSHDYGPL